MDSLNKTIHWHTNYHETLKKYLVSWNIFKPCSWYAVRPVKLTVKLNRDTVHIQINTVAKV